MAQDDIDLSFTYMIFQPNMRKGNISTWIDGNKIKKVYKLEDFGRILHARNQNLYGNIQQVLNTYSFYMISSESDVVKKLDPSGKDSLYKDEVNAFFTGTAKQVKEKKTLIESLATLGFDPMSDSDMNELNISLSPQIGKMSLIDRLSRILRAKK